VTYTVYDNAGNNATCSFAVLVIDVTPPEITCPSTEVMYYDTSAQSVEAHFPDVLVIDTSPVTLKYQPANGTQITMMETQIISVLAQDSYGNEASCNFSYVAKRKYLLFSTSI